MLVLTEGHVEEVVEKFGTGFIMRNLIQRVNKVFHNQSLGKISHAQRKSFSHENDLIEWMPVQLGQEDFAIKVVSYFPDNPHQMRLPTIDAMIAECDFKSGQMGDLVAGRLITAMRTGAASAVASSYLAHPESEILGLIGCGAQAVTQAHALCLEFPIKKILAFDIDEQEMQAIVDKLAFLNVQVVPVDRREIEQQADIICTVTSTPLGSEPVINTDHLKDHVHINAVGSDFPGKTELPKGFVQNTFIATDFLLQARAEGECQSLKDGQLEAGLCVELCEVVHDPKRFEHLRNHQTIFDSTGIGMEDAVAAQFIKELARNSNIGIEISAAKEVISPKNPYGAIDLKNAQALAG